ncbi:MAG: agmatine deiminase family protein [Bacteroidales bacterium]|nr:agmatine deiminase family protein [Bacteroidales bacterium]
MVISNKKNLVLILPDPKKEQLFEFYKELIRIVRTNLEENILVFGSEEQILLITEGAITCECLESNKSSERFVQEVNVYWCFCDSIVPDIWVRDYAPVYLHNHCVKFTYDPYYFYKHEKCIAQELQKFGSTLPYLSASIVSNSSDSIGRMDVNLIDLPLILDGGNCICNGKGDVVMTRRVLVDNPSCSETDIENLLKAYGVKKIHFIDCEPGDVTGHVDGVVRFVDSDSVVVSDLPRSYVADSNPISKKEYMEDLAYLDKVADEMSRYYKVTRLINCIPRKDVKEGMPSAFGNFTNFFFFDHCLFVPQYGIEVYDSNACKTLSEAFRSLNPTIVKVDCSVLSSYGGVLTCITWEF